MGMFDLCFGSYPKDDGLEVEDDDAIALSYIGMAAYEVLRKEHNQQHNRLWNVTSGAKVGEVHQTPNHEPFDSDNTTDPSEGHSDWFPEKMAEILGRTTVWADVLSLAPPDGKFMELFQIALAAVATRAKENGTKVTIRMMFGNIVGMPVNCNAIAKQLGAQIPDDALDSIRMWVGAWRKGVSWNHAKIIAVDGKYLHTGGHNMWDSHYLKDSPVHDLSFELEGRVAHDGHLFANDQWDFIESKQSTCCGEMVDKLPDNIPLVARTRVTVSEYPEGQTTIFPPRYQKQMVGSYELESQQVPMLTLGRYGSILKYYRPADDAFIAMFDSAKTIIRMALQDLGPVCIPKTKIAVPGCIWPKEYLNVLGKAIWERGVDVEIVLSNPNSIPGGLKPVEANYGNGWSCVDVAAEIIKTIRNQYPDAADADLRQKVEENLRVCFLRRKQGSQWETGMSMGLHSKHFIIDDKATYIGSQNLYICDLAEWGVVVDHEETTQAIMQEYWNPMWSTSYIPGEDVDVQAVMDGLDIDRDGETTGYFGSSAEQWQQQQEAAIMQTGMGVKAGELEMDETDVSE